MNTFFTANTVSKVDELSESGFHYVKCPQGGSTMTEQDYNPSEILAINQETRGLKIT